MKPGAFAFSDKWAEIVRKLPETGMGYTVADIVLRDGRRFVQAVIDSGHVTRVRGLPTVPFSEDEITDIVPTHQRFDWSESP